MVVVFLRSPVGGGEDPCRSANCDARATCIAEESSYTCVCKSGFEGNGQRCQGKRSYFTFQKLRIQSKRNDILLFIIRAIILITGNNVVLRYNN